MKTNLQRISEKIDVLETLASLIHRSENKGSFMAGDWELTPLLNTGVAQVIYCSVTEGGMCEHAHEDSDEHFLVLSGEFYLEIKGVRRVYTTNEYAFVSAGEPHACGSTGKTEIITVIIPPEKQYHLEHLK